MKKLIRNVIYILAIAIILISCNINTCSSDNEGLCELENIATFKVEDNASITVGVFNQGFGEDIVNSWDKTHPELLGLVNFEVVEPDNKENLDTYLSDYDLIQFKSENVPLYFNKLAAFDASFASILDNENLSKFSNQINQTDYFFMPFDVEGLLFAYNKTILEEFEVDLTDGDNNGLPDLIDSFEKIADLASEWRQKELTYLDESLQNIFSFPLNEQLAMIAFFQNSGYRLIQGSSAEMLDLGKDLDLALENLYKLGNDKWRFDANLNNDQVWNYEQVLINQSAPFLLVGNWMYYDHYQRSKAYELVFTKLPTVNGLDLASISNVSGFVLSKDSEYPNAANMVLEHIKGPEGTQIAINNGIVPIINQELLKVDGFNIDRNTKEQIIAYQYSEPSPLQAFKQKPEKRGWDIYLEVDFRPIFKDVFLNKITPQKAAEEIKEKIKDWLDNEDITIEGVNDEQLDKDN